MPVKVEVCIDSLESAQAIASRINEGEHRVELCSNLIYGGGLTPSIGLFRQVAKLIPSRKVMVMIRPRAGSFVYTDSELDTMLFDIDSFKKQHAGGFVFGCLRPDGGVNVDQLRRLVEAASPHHVTFHRAFDVTPDWKKAFADIAEVEGVTRILTSGHASRAVEGLDQLAELTDMADSRQSYLAIVPASGINSMTGIQILDRIPGIRDLHLSCSEAVRPSLTTSTQRGEELGFGMEEWKFNRKRMGEFWAALEGWTKNRPEVKSESQV